MVPTKPTKDSKINFYLNFATINTAQLHALICDSESAEKLTRDHPKLNNEKLVSDINSPHPYGFTILNIN